MNQRGAMELSFGMIFAIILIAAFIAFAFFGIKSFMAVQEQVKYRQFTEDLQSDVDKIWKSAQASKQVSYLVPSKVKEVCFENKETKNLIFNPRNPDFANQTIKNLDVELMFPEEFSTPVCIKTKEGSVSLRLSKDYNRNFVNISIK
jgi:hypothetical protein